LELMELMACGVEELSTLMALSPMHPCQSWDFCGGVVLEVLRDFHRGKGIMCVSGQRAKRLSSHRTEGLSGVWCCGVAVMRD